MLLLIDTFLLFSKLWRTSNICGNLFDLQRSSELSQRHWHHSPNNIKWLKQLQSHFHSAISHKSHHFPLYWCILCTATSYISSSNKNINNTARFSRLSFPFLWMFCFPINFRQLVLLDYENWKPNVCKSHHFHLLEIFHFISVMVFWRIQMFGWLL